MKNMICERCGSTNIVADRALAGRLVCSKCGSSSIKSSSAFYIKRKINKLLSRNKTIFFIMAVCLVICILASL